jgi:hypothetical protein
MSRQRHPALLFSLHCRATTPIIMRRGTSHAYVSRLSLFPTVSLPEPHRLIPTPLSCDSVSLGWHLFDCVLCVE